MAWQDGFKIGYEMNRVEIPSMSENLSQWQKSINVGKQLEAQQKEAAKQYVQSVKQSVGKDTDATIFDVNFDDTGLFDYDVTADKLQEQYRENSKYNTWLFTNGKISEDEYKYRQRTLKGNILSVDGMYESLAQRNDELAKVQSEGKDSYVNGFKSELLANMGTNFSASAGLDGSIKFSTIDARGRLITAVPTVLKTLSEVDTGADIDSALNDIIEKKGFSEYLNQDASKKIMDYTLNTESVSRLVDVKAKGFTETQVVDAAIKLGVLTTDEADQDAENYIDAVKWSTLRKEDIDKLRDQVSNAMVDYTMDKYDLQMGTRAFKPEKEDEQDLFQVGAMEVGDPGIEYADGIKSGKDYDEDTLLGTMMTAQGVDLTNEVVEANVESISDLKAFKQKNYDLYDSKGAYLGGNPDRPLKIHAISTPSEFSSKDIDNMGVPSQSEKQWSSINGIVIVKGRVSARKDDGSIPSPYNFRLQGSVKRVSAQETAKTDVPKKGATTSVTVTSKETAVKLSQDVSLPIPDTKLPVVWNSFLAKNKDISEAYKKVVARAKADGENLTDPVVFRDLIGETLEQFYTK